MSNVAAKGIFSTRVTTGQRVKQKVTGSLFTAFKVIIIILFFTLFYLSSRLLVVSLGYEIAKANKERAELVAENKRLKFEALSLKSPQRIETIASDKFDLVYAKGEQIITIK